MWFNNALIYKYELDETVDFASLLAEEILKPCPPHARFIYGWLPAFADELVQEVAGCSLICLGKEERILPRGVINRMLAERVQAIETQQGRAIKRAEKAQIAEDLEFELLPKSFCVQKQLPALLDSVEKRLIINASSNNQASQLTSLLRKSIPGIQIEPLAHQDNLALRFAHWISDPSLLPPSFQLASDCLLFSLDDEKKRVNCKGYELPAEEILTLLSQGLAAAEISLIWNERIQFTLTHDLVFKRLKSLDYLIDEFNEIRDLEEEYQQRDAALTLLGGELRSLVNELLVNLNSNETAEENKEKAGEEVCPA
ncbi:Recombination-associated protein RdgC [Legionella massiliensis]|uniref:Recombination-associated protein RdgC n=1 Tax=Legionella massiliensis TaxID=1034943 RepID=A0A078L1B4_9GAMM|nr:recombination-associated protein RdgC [Legionella massiliensis]CDZ79022.1 Recombination-associated protein RdgC [Legionella massiliensis]CEE14760.1 Recombination-associated protein RdgC [Legionella massiliensis]